MKRIGWFTTGRGPGSLGLFSTMRSMIRSGEMDAKLAFVFLNREVKGNPNRTKLIAMAEEEGVPVIILPSDGFRNDLKKKDLNAWRAAYGKVMREKISEHPMDFGVLAGYMLVLDLDTCSKYDIINLHPALPSTYQGTWEDIVRQVAESEDTTYGSMVHVCTPELDRGATVAYDEFGIDDLRKKFSSKEELASALRERQRSREVPLLMETIRMLTEGQVILVRGRLVDDQGRPISKAPNLASSIDQSTER
jgi:phosphoribosylglycinamide formyltransferase-1